MNSKSGNNKFDIVSEAEAVLAAYSERCRQNVVRTRKSQRPMQRFVWWAFLFVAIAAVLCYVIFVH